MWKVTALGKYSINHRSVLPRELRELSVTEKAQKATALGRMGHSLSSVVMPGECGRGWLSACLKGVCDSTSVFKAWVTELTLESALKTNDEIPILVCSLRSLIGKRRLWVQLGACHSHHKLKVDVRRQASLSLCSASPSPGYISPRVS